MREATEREKLKGTEPVSQFGRMCAKLGIQIIAANSPQAKGRVERAHGTHQDRLVKKLRLAGVSDYAAANRFLAAGSLADHNRRFRRDAASDADFHRKRPSKAELDAAFRLEQERVLSLDWVVSYEGKLLQLERQSRHHAPAKSRVLVRENQAGELAIRVSRPQTGLHPDRTETGPQAPAVFRVRPSGRTRNTIPNPPLEAKLQTDPYPAGQLLNHQPERRHF